MSGYFSDAELPQVLILRTVYCYRGIQVILKYFHHGKVMRGNLAFKESIISGVQLDYVDHFRML